MNVIDTATDIAGNPLTLLVVHAHPDDECIGTGGALARYSAEGVRTVLITATLGDEGEIHDPELVEEEARPRLATIREEELRRAVKVLSVSELELLGYRDSGMIDTPANAHPDNFHNANFEEAVGRVVRLIRRHRPQVVVTYNEDGGYGHPDHLQCHRVTAAAYDAAGDPTRFPGVGEPWSPSKFYATAWSRELWQGLREEMQARGIPFGDEREDEGADEAEKSAAGEEQGAEADEPWGQPEESITAFIDTSPYWATAREALRQHRTQPLEFFLKLPDDLAAKVYARDFFILLRASVETARPEDDLFAGLRAPVGATANAG
ncbi:MAG TPA: PIG-L family deacetylase [Thermomicrobiales bacterium]|jgi:N-acetyl-1-D-myo-inositol-2-amino-2-deoxy-alpha-D-glucopyranoside deacetylase